MNISTNPWTWIMAICILGMFSFLYKENPFYRLTEHAFVGAGAGYAISTAFTTIRNNAWVPLTTKGTYHMIVPIILGLLLYARFVKQYAWMSRWSISYLVGIGVGMSLITAFSAQVVVQLRASFITFLVKDGAGKLILSRSINNAIIVLGLLSCLAYFVFSVERKGIMKPIAIPGRWILMLTFGVAFGNVVAGRINLLIGALKSLLGPWLGLI